MHESFCSCVVYSALFVRKFCNGKKHGLVLKLSPLITHKDALYSARQKHQTSWKPVWKYLMIFSVEEPATVFH